jgi:acetyl-CoA C-acetyltransferase
MTASAPAPGAPRRVAVLDGSRIPVVPADGAYATASNPDMPGAALDGLIRRFALADTVVGEGEAADQQACGTSLEAVILVADKIALGQIDCGIAGGVDTASDAPLGPNASLRRVLRSARRARGAGARVRVPSATTTANDRPHQAGTGRGAAHGQDVLSETARRPPAQGLGHTDEGARQPGARENARGDD